MWPSRTHSTSSGQGSARAVHAYPTQRADPLTTQPIDGHASSSRAEHLAPSISAAVASALRDLERADSGGSHPEKIRD